MGTVISDDEIIDLYIKRDESAIAFTRDKYGDTLYRIANRIIEDDMDAEECENDVYYQAWISIPPHEPRTYLLNYLAKIARNRAVKKIREKRTLKRFATIVDIDKEIDRMYPKGNDPEDIVQAAELGNEINSFLGGISKKHRVIFLKRYWYMESIDQISMDIQISKNQVWVILNRTQKKLKKYLIDKGLV